MGRELRLGVVIAMATGAALATVSTAHADDVMATRFDACERSHVIEIRVDRGHAMLVVTRVVENTGPKSDQATFGIDLPTGAVATRLRTAGVDASGKPIWFEGELMEAEEAARKYKELTGIGGYYPKDPALLSWRSQTHLALQVFPVAPRSQKTVEYTLRMPAEYRDGAYLLELPKLGTADMPPKLRIVAEHPDDRVDVGGVEVSRTTTISGANPVVIRLEPRGVAPIDGALASFGFAKDRNLVHARISAAPRLSQVPAGAAVVLLLDTSRSMDDSLAAELTAARAYLSRFPGSTVEVMTFDRKVRSPFGGAVPVKEALSRLYTLAPVTANGSELDDALARADAALAQSPSATRRILLLTDLRTREALTAEKLAARTVASGAIVHVATVTDGGGSLARDDDDPWAALPRKTGGLLWHASALSTGMDAAGREIFEEWVRPKRIDKLVVKGLPSDFEQETSLAEGAGLAYLGIAPAAVANVSLEGELWSRPVRWSAMPSADESRRWSALVFGSSLIGELNETEEMALAMNGRAVSPVTSYLAIEPGVRPSTEGLEEGGGTGQGTGIGFGQGFGNGHGRAGGSHSQDPHMFLDGELASALTVCGAAVGTSVKATVESTLAEIVEVRDVALAPARDAKTESCIGERLWQVTLTSAFDTDHSNWSLEAHR